MDTPTDTLRLVGEQLAALAVGSAPAATSPAQSDDALCGFAVELERVGRLVDALRVQVAGEIAERSRFSAGSDGLSDRYGFRTGAHLLEFLARVSAGEARRRSRLGASIRPDVGLDGSALPAAHPVVAEALGAGEIGVESAGVIVRCLDQASPTAAPDDIVAAEAALVTAAKTESTDLVAVQARAWREALDPDGAEPRDERIQRLRSFRVGVENEKGLTPFSGAADPVFAALLRNALDNANRPRVAPRFLSEADRQTGLSLVETDEGTVVESVSDPRTREQRNYDVLHGVVTAGLRSTGTESGELRDLAQVVAVITMDDLASGTGAAWIDDVAEPISAATVEEIVCGQGLAKVIVGENGEPLYLGRHKRYFTSQQMRALAVRDGGCVWPGCSAPASWAEGHHVVPWKDDGPTDIDNGALLCPYHHRKLHRSGFRLRMIDARPHMLLTPAMDPAQRWRPIGRSRIEAVQVRRKKAG